MTELSMLNLRFTARVESTIQLHEFKGSALRGAWQTHLRTLYCTHQGKADPLHEQLCPVCYLLGRAMNGGDERSPYSFRPPLDNQTRYEVGESLVFEASLFGEAQQHLAYLVMAVGQMGLEQGLGQPIHAGHQRGKFRLVQLEAVDPFRGAKEVLMDLDPPLSPLIQGGQKRGDGVRWPTLQITESSVLAVAEELGRDKAGSGDKACLVSTEAGEELTLHFLTPMRLIVDKKLVKEPEFGSFFRRLLERWSALRQQFAHQPRLDNRSWDGLIALADSVELVRNECHWHEVRGHSTRLDRAQELGGLVGRASYRMGESANGRNDSLFHSGGEGWRELLPFLLWGQVMQVGKNTVKGGGVYQLVMS